MLQRGYTEEQVENHLSYKRNRTKKSRDDRRKNNEKNKELIQKIKTELLNKTFGNIKVLSISPTVDGKGFWFRVFKTYKDGSKGILRNFCYFDEYSKDEILSV